MTCAEGLAYFYTLNQNWLAKVQQADPQRGERRFCPRSQGQQMGKPRLDADSYLTQVSCHPISPCPTMVLPSMHQSWGLRATNHLVGEVGRRHLPTRVGAFKALVNVILKRRRKKLQWNPISAKRCLSPRHLSPVLRGDWLQPLLPALINRDCPLFVTKRVQDCALDRSWSDPPCMAYLTGFKS